MSDKEKSKTVKIKEKLLKGKVGDKEGIEIKIRTADGKEQEAKFKKLDKEEESTEEIAFEFMKKENDKWTEKWVPFKSKVKWNGSFISNGMKLSNKKVDEVEIKDDITVPMGFFKTPTIWSWIGLFIIFAGIVALIWWWIASSNKEDKEEESL